MGNNHSEQKHQGNASPDSKLETPSKQKKPSEIWNSYRNKTRVSTQCQTQTQAPFKSNLFPSTFGSGAPSPLSKPQESTDCPDNPARDGVQDTSWTATAPPAFKPVLQPPKFVFGSSAINNQSPATFPSFDFSLWSRDKDPSCGPQSVFQTTAPPSSVASVAAPSTKLPSCLLTPPRSSLELPSQLTPSSQTFSQIQSAKDETEATRHSRPSKGPDPVVTSVALETAKREDRATTPYDRPPKLDLENPASTEEIINKLAKLPITWGRQAAPIKPCLRKSLEKKNIRINSPSLTPGTFHFTATGARNAQAPSVFGFENEAADQGSVSPQDQSAAPKSEGKNDKDIKGPNGQDWSLCFLEEMKKFSRLRDVQKQKLFPDPLVCQNKAVMKNILKGVSYSEAVRRAQPKINPGRGEAKSGKKGKMSKAERKLQQRKKGSPGTADLMAQLPSNSSGDSHQLKEAAAEALPTKEVGAELNSQVNLHKGEQNKTPSDLANSKKVLRPTVRKIPIQEETNDLVANPFKPSETSGKQTKLQEVIPNFSVCETDSHEKLTPVNGSISVDQQCKSMETGELQAKAGESTTDKPLEMEPGSSGALFTSTMKGSRQNASETGNSKLQMEEDPIVTHGESRGRTEPKASQKATTTNSPSLVPPESGRTADVNGLLREEKVKEVEKDKLIDLNSKSSTKIPIEDHSKSAGQPPKSRTKSKPVQILPAKPETTDVSENKGGAKPPVADPSSPRRSGQARCWAPFTVDRSCTQKVRSAQSKNARLPRNVRQWLNTSQNHLCEPPWITTASLAASIALSIRLDGEDCC